MQPLWWHLPFSLLFVREKWDWSCSDLYFFQGVLLYVFSLAFNLDEKELCLTNLLKFGPRVSFIVCVFCLGYLNGG